VRRGIDDEENGLGDIRGGKGSITLVYLGGGFPVAVEAHFGKFRADGAGGDHRDPNARPREVDVHALG